VSPTVGLDQGSTGTNTNLEMREAQYEMSTQTQIQSHYRQYQWISHHEDQGTWPFPAASPLQTFIARAFQSASPSRTQRRVLGQGFRVQNLRKKINKIPIKLR
jgi:hypothetical protein